MLNDNFKMKNEAAKSIQNGLQIHENSFKMTKNKNSFPLFKRVSELCPAPAVRPNRKVLQKMRLFLN